MSATSKTVAADYKLPEGQRAVLPYISPATAPPAVKDAFKVLPFERNVLKLVANAEGFFPPFMNLLSCFFTEARALPAVEWQLTVLRLATISDFPYVWEINTPVALVNGMSDEKRLAIKGNDFSLSYFTNRDRALVKLVDQSVKNNDVDDETLAELRSLFTPREIEEAIIIAGAYTIFGRTSKIARIDRDPEIPGLSESLSALIENKN